ncbi:MAG: phosphate ABC transporter permease subunit PstC [Anaerolineae bacterium]|nr:phosphate ABC transporter permease subunit PstC [Anaerolineae bacterium]
MQTQLEAGREISRVQSAVAARRAQATLYKRPRPGEDAIRVYLLLCGILSIFTTLGIIFVLGEESLRFFTSGVTNAVEFLTSIKWQPQAGEFGILPLLESTLMTSFMAMLVAIPLGLGSAIYLAEYAPSRVRSTMKPILEVLAGIPTVVYGYFALTFMTPALRGIFGQDAVQIYNTAAAGIVMGIMILPTISSMAEDALSSVPRSLREASYGLGATRFETIVKVVLPAALSGILAAFIIGISRAVGETMIVALAAGAGSNWSFPPNFFVAAETMTGHIARISGGDLSYDSVDYNSLFAIGLMLFFITLGLNLLSQWVSKRFREVYQ